MCFVNSAGMPLLSAQPVSTKSVFPTENKPDLLKEKMQDWEAKITRTEEVSYSSFVFVLACGCGVVHL